MFQELNEFGSTRAELYREGLDILLRKWDAKRGIERERPYGLSVTDLETLLGEIAYRRFLASEYFFEQQSLEKQIEDFFTERSLLASTQELRPDRVLDSIESHLGLLVQRAVRVYSFSHLTFQEYLTAQRVAKKKTLLTEIGPKVGERRWREVWLLLATMIDEDDIMPEVQGYADMIVKNEPVIQSYLTSRRGEIVAKYDDYKPAAVRAFLFGLDLAADRGSGPTDESERLTFEAALQLARLLDPSLSRGLIKPDSDHRGTCALALAYTLARALSRIRMLSLGRDGIHDLTSELCRIRDTDLASATEAARVISPTVAKKLYSLRREVSTDPVWWYRRREQWHETLRAIAIEHCGFGGGWDFSTGQRDLLRAYYNANLVLVECISASRGLTNKTRQHIEDTLLLP